MHNIIGSKDKTTFSNRVDTLEIPKELGTDVNKPSTSKTPPITYTNTQSENSTANVEKFSKLSKRKACVTKADVLRTIVNCNDKL